MRRVQSGERIRKPIAADANLVADAAEDYLRRRGGERQGHNSPNRPLPDIIKVKNLSIDSPGDRRAGDLLSVKPTKSSAELIDEFDNAHLWFKAGEPSVGLFGICRKAIPYGEIGELIIAGGCKAWVNVLDTDHAFADVPPGYSGAYVLVSAEVGRVELMWQADATGEQEMGVVLGRRLPGDRDYFGKVSGAAITPYGSGDVEIWTSPTSASGTVIEDVWHEFLHRGRTLEVDDWVRFRFFSYYNKYEIVDALCEGETA